MRRSTSKLLSILLVLCMVLALLPGTALAAETSGTCGDNLTWSLANGTLTISGTGPMADYTLDSGSNPVPWHDQRETIFTVVIKDGVTSIGAYAFQGCNMTSVDIPDSVNSIGQHAFQDCTRLTSITIPDGVATIEESTFVMCYNMVSVKLPDSVTVIKDRAFSTCGRLTDINIPDGVTSIGEAAFYGCQLLISMTIPDGVTSIGNDTFSICSELTSVIIPGSVTKIGAHAFSECDQLTDVYYGGNESQWNQIEIDSTPEDGGNDNGNAPLLGAAKHYNSTSIETPSLSGSCGDNLTWSLVNGTLTISGTGKMYDYEEDAPAYEKAAPWYEHFNSITAVVIEDGVTSIGNFAFLGCRMTGIDIPDSVNSIGENAFRSCWRLLNVKLPDGITNTGASAFSMCYSLIDVSIPDSVKIIDDWTFFSCRSLTDISLPNGVTTIGGDAFTWCYGLTSVTIPDSVTSIGDGAFTECGMTGVTIPSSVTSLGEGAFYGCPYLTSVTIPTSITSIKTGTFGETPLTDVYYAGSESQWKAIEIDNSYDGNAPLLGATIHYNSVGTAYPGTLKAEIDGRPVYFNTYGIKDANGNMTTYVQVRDLALEMNGTLSPFNVTYDSAAGVANLVSNTDYKPTGNEGSTPFSGERDYQLPPRETYIDGAPSDLVAFYLSSDDGGGYTYYQIRDLGDKLGFSVVWNDDLKVAVITSGTGN